MREQLGAVIVTGAGSGIGLAIAAALRDDGIAVRGLDLEPAGMTEKFDVTDEAAWDALDDTGIAGIVHSAGIRRQSAIDEMSVDEFRSVVDTNVTGAFLALRWAARASQRRQAQNASSQESLSIVIVSSAVVDRLPERQAAYNASKAAVIAFTRSAALELAPLGSRANVIAPGSILTPMTEAGWADKAHAARMRAEIPAGRPGTAGEIANVARFLLSDASSYLNGSVITADGGWTL